MTTRIFHNGHVLTELGFERDACVVVEDGPPEQVLGNPREARTREFIERVFHIKA